MLDLSNLKSHRGSLLQIIEHTKRELEAVDLLIEGFRVRGADGTIDVTTRKRRGLPATILEIVQEKKGSWIKAGDVTSQLISRGIRSEAQRRSIRASVSGYLRELTDKGKLTRRNVGSAVSTVYEYKAVEQQMNFVEK